MHLSASSHHGRSLRCNLSASSHHGRTLDQRSQQSSQSYCAGLYKQRPVTMLKFNASNYCRSTLARICIDVHQTNDEYILQNGTDRLLRNTVQKMKRSVHAWLVQPNRQQPLSRNRSGFVPRSDHLRAVASKRTI
jgi:hypothetical protein